MKDFTPGTWKYLDAINQVCAFDENAKWANDWPKDITGELCGTKEEEIYANGRLIAAAPEMYRILRYLQAYCLDYDIDSDVAEDIDNILERIDSREGK